MLIRGHYAYRTNFVVFKRRDKMINNSSKSFKSELNIKHVSYLFMIVYLLKQIWQWGRANFFAILNIDIASPTGTLTLSIISQIVIRFLPCLILCYMLRQNLGKVFKFRKVTIKQILICFGAYIASNLTIAFIHKVTCFIAEVVGKQYEMNDYLLANNYLSVFILIIAIGIIPPVFEELFFRGFMFTGGQKYGPIFVILFTSFAFAITHDNPYRLVEIFYYAIISGLIVFYTESIWPGMIIHILTNSVYVIGSYLSGGDFVESIDTSYSLGSFALSGVMGIIGIVLSFYMISLLKRISSNKDTDKSMILKGKFNTVSIGEFICPMLVVIIVFIIKCSI